MIAYTFLCLSFILSLSMYFRACMCISLRVQNNSHVFVCIVLLTRKRENEKEKSRKQSNDGKNSANSLFVCMYAYVHVLPKKKQRRHTCLFMYVCCCLLANALKVRNIRDRFGIILMNFMLKYWSSADFFHTFF